MRAPLALVRSHGTGISAVHVLRGVTLVLSVFERTRELGVSGR